MQDTLEPSLVLTPIRNAAPAAGGTLEVLVRVQAPDGPPAESRVQPRPPLRLAVVVDRSGSMSGEPLHEALRCAEYIAAGLKATDQLAVVLYDDSVRTPVPLGNAGDAAAVRQALAGVESGGSTALFDGWEAGARMLEASAPGTTSRVLLLSDGQANRGLCDTAEIARHCALWAQRGISTTTVGLGRDFNEDLMVAMAQAGAGQQYYGQTAADLHDSFDEELLLLQSMFLRQLRVKLVPAQGVIAEPLGIVRAGDPVWTPLTDLAWGAESWLLVRLHVSPAANAGDPREAQPLLVVVAEGRREQGGGPVFLNAMLSLPMLGGSDLRGLPQDETVARRLQEVEFAEAAGRIRERLRHGDVQGAKKDLARLEAEVADHPWLAEKVRGLRELAERDVQMVGKEMAYSMNRTSRRLVAKDEMQYSASETDSLEVPAYLRRKPSEGQGRRKPKP